MPKTIFSIGREGIWPCFLSFKSFLAILMTYLRLIGSGKELPTNSGEMKIEGWESCTGASGAWAYCWAGFSAHSSNASIELNGCNISLATRLSVTNFSFIYFSLATPDADIGSFCSTFLFWPFSLSGRVTLISFSSSICGCFWNLILLLIPFWL